MNILITQVSKFGAMSWIKCLKRISSMDITLYGCDIYPKLHFGISISSSYLYQDTFHIIAGRMGIPLFCENFYL